MADNTLDTTLRFLHGDDDETNPLSVRPATSLPLSLSPSLSLSLARARTQTHAPCPVSSL